ncbi:uridine kinase family protein [Nocardioides sp. MAHUQ-72]|uniref:uridine kinase family protein n=1 Tax=unclassified Nocardioides TaxID=2615069 RepID=UPI003621A8F8
MDTAGLLLELAESRAPTLGGARLVCIDGPAGSGKTTLAAAVAAARPGTPVVHMDDLYDGWEGLPRLVDQLAGLLRPLAAGRRGSYRRYDWHAGRYAETVTVGAAPLVVLEGVGCGARAHADLVTLLVWVHAPADLRLRRGLERDGVALEGRWRQWMTDEAVHHVLEGTEERADLLVDGTGVEPPQVR